MTEYLVALAVLAAMLASTGLVIPRTAVVS